MKLLPDPYDRRQLRTLGDVRCSRAISLPCRRLAITGIIILILGLCRTDAWEPEPGLGTRELQATMRNLLRDLDANQRTRRQQAERELLDLGPRILPLLPAPELLPNQAVRTTVSRIRVTLERRKAQESVQASHVSLPANLTLAAWLEGLESQTANPINTSGVQRGRLQQHVSASCRDEPFWEALNRTLTEQNLRVEFSPDSSDLKVVPQAANDTERPWAATVQGPFHIALNWVRPRKVEGNAAVQRLRTEIGVAPEPRLRALFLKLAAKDFQAVGPQGTVFPAADSGAQYDLPLGEGGRYVRWNLDFSAPGEFTEKEIFPLQIKGTAAMQVAADSEHIRFTDLVDGEGTARRRGGVTVTVQKIKSRMAEDGTQSLSIKVLVVYDTGGPAFESHRTWIFHNQVYLDRDDAPQLPPNGGFDTDLQTNGAVGVTYRFDGLKDSLDKYHFVYVAPTLIVDVPFQIELKGITPPPRK